MLILGVVDIAQEAADKFPGLSVEMSGLYYRILPQIFRIISSRRVLAPGTFNSFDGTPSVYCAFKNARGSLYVMEKRLFFITKYPTQIMYDRIDYIEFQRYTGAYSVTSTSFDMMVQLKVQCV